MRFRRWVPPLMLTMLATACAPSSGFNVGVHNDPVNIRLGDVPLAASNPQPINVPTSGLGFITAPLRLDVPPTVVAPSPSLVPSCPQASPDTPAEAVAPSEVDHGPKQGTYRFRRSGYIRIGEAGDDPSSLPRRPKQPLFDDLVQQVGNVQETRLLNSPPRITFDVTQIEPNLITTTSYLVDPIGSDQDPRVRPGLEITKIQLQRADLPGNVAAGAGGNGGVETFSPQPAVKIMTLPEQIEAPPTDPNNTLTGVDATNAATMQVFEATSGRTTVDVCGRVIQGWQVHVSFPDTSAGSFTSTYKRTNVRHYSFSGDFVFAPQFCLILQQNFTFNGTDVGNKPYELQSSATLNSLDPS